MGEFPANSFILHITEFIMNNHLFEHLHAIVLLG